MPTHDQLAAALHVGLLARDGAGPDVATSALRLVLDAVGGDAACLVSGGLDTRHRQVAAVGYPGPVARCLTEDFAASPWHGIVLASSLPPSISTEPAQTFRRGWMFEEVMAPAGFRDGVSGALRRQGRYVGAVHVSSAHERAFDGDGRAVLKLLGEALAVLADPAPARGAGPEDGYGDAWDDGVASCLLVPEPVPLPGRRLPEVATDPDLHRLAAELAALGGRMSFLWPGPGAGQGQRRNQGQSRRQGQGRAWSRVGLLSRRGRGDVVLTERPAQVPFGLSSRELDVLTRMALGLGNDEIAASLVISPRTVHTHVERVLAKTGSRSRTQAAAMAVAGQVLRPDASLLAHDRAGVLRRA